MKTIIILLHPVGPSVVLYKLLIQQYPEYGPVLFLLQSEYGFIHYKDIHGFAWLEGPDEVAGDRNENQNDEYDKNSFDSFHRF